MHARRMLQDSEASRDVVQDVFIALWKSRNTLDSKTQIAAFLYTVTRNNVLNKILREKTRTKFLEFFETFDAQQQAGSDDLIRTKQLQAQIELEINALPPKMREIFIMSRNQSLSYREISEQLDITEHTVKKQISNAIKLLRIKLRLIFLLGI
jgi:RNA polymerase sigma-70 factor (ECF subfamily)